MGKPLETTEGQPRNEDVFMIGVKAIVRNPEGKILLLESAQASHRTLPGGRIEQGEGTAETLRRELGEEIGVRDFEITSFFAGGVTSRRISQGDVTRGLALLVYEVKLPADSQIKVGEEYESYGWFYPAEAADILEVDFPPEVIEKLRQHQVEGKNGKLVRDNVPRIIEGNGERPITHTAGEKEVVAAAIAKFQEELKEFISAKNPEDKTKELADIIEVFGFVAGLMKIGDDEVQEVVSSFYTLGKLFGIDRNEIERIRNLRKEMLGGFESRVIFDGTE